MGATTRIQFSLALRVKIRAKLLVFVAFDLCWIGSTGPSVLPIIQLASDDVLWTIFVPQRLEVTGELSFLELISIIPSYCVCISY